MKKVIFYLALTVVFIGSYINSSAHCDTMEGPVIKDAKTAIEKNNVNFVLKWVSNKDENELKSIFEQTMKVRTLSSDARELADRFFFESLVIILRTGEGVPFTGVLPVGSTIDEKILAADKSIEIGNLSPLQNHVGKDKMKHLNHLFEKVMSLKNFDVNNVEAGREYVEAYIKFFHFAEGEEEAIHKHQHE